MHEKQISTRILSQSSYDASGKVKTSTDQYGGVTTNFYDARGMLVRTTYPDGTETRSVYDSFGRVILAMDRYKPVPAGEPETAMSTRTIYDASGRVISTQRMMNASIVITQDGTKDIYNVTDVGGAGIDADADTGQWRVYAQGSTLSQTQTKYNGSGQVVETINNDGLRIGTIYYPNGQIRYSGVLKSSVTESWWDSLASDPVASNYFDSYTSYAYHLTDNLPSGAISYDKVTDALGHVTRTYVDGLGRNIKTLFDDGTSTQTLYGSGTDPVSGHPVNGQTITGHQETKLDQLNRATDYFYDQAGRLTDVYLPQVADAISGSNLRPHWLYSYDANGNQATQIDPKGHTTSFTYDEFGHRIERKLPLNQSETSSYDSFGRLNQSIDFKGNTTVYVYYDSGVNAGRLQYKRYFTPSQALNSTPNQEVQYSYDSLGRTDTVTERSTGTTLRVTSYGYDPITGGVTLETLYDSASSSYAKIMRHAYDLATGRLIATWTASNLTSATDLSGARTAAITLTEYGYDTFGRLQTTTLKRVNSTTVSKITTNSYDVLGNLDTVTQPNGVITDYDYDGLNRLNHEVVTKSNGNKVFEQTYTLLADGQRDYVIEKRFDGSGNGNFNVFSNVKVDWIYDALNRLSGETWDADTTPGNGSDNFGTQEGSDYIDSYSFDLAGNRISKVHDAVGSGSDETVTSTYDNNDRLTATSSTISANSATYNYDANGSTASVTTSAGTKTNVWDVRNRLVGYDANGDGDTSDSGDATYSYTDNGQRVSKTIVGTGTTYFVIDGSNPTGYAQVLEERGTITGSPQQTYILALDVSGQVSGTGSYSYFGYDGHGNTSLLTDLNGAQVTSSSFNYDAFGTSLSGPTSLTKLLYSGESWDAEKGSYFQRGREDYIPSLGRFDRRDPTTFGIGETLNANPYVFGSGNPVFYSDPSGLFIMTTTESTATASIWMTVLAISVPVLTGVGFAAYSVAHSPTFALETVAKNLGVDVAPDYKPRPNGSDVYFLHGTTVDLWGNSKNAEARSRPDADFGRGFYTFESTLWGYRSASKWAIDKTNQGGIGCVIEFSMSKADYAALRSLDFRDPAEAPYWKEFVEWNRSGQNGTQCIIPMIMPLPLDLLANEMALVDTRLIINIRHSLLSAILLPPGCILLRSTRH